MEQLSVDQTVGPTDKSFLFPTIQDFSFWNQMEPKRGFSVFYSLFHSPNVDFLCQKLFLMGYRGRGRVTALVTILAIIFMDFGDRSICFRDREWEK